jgi:uncharacterized protein (TIGR04255 family)
MEDTASPFEGYVPEIPLPAAPLARVLAQLRYPRPLDFDARTSVESVRKALASRYPVNREAKAAQIVITSAGVTQEQSPDTNWVFEDVQAQWKVTLGDKAASIETTSYTSRADFCERISDLIHVIGKSLRPPVYDRLGLRYINQLEGTEVQDELKTLVRPISLAGLAVPHQGVQIQHSLCDTLFIDENRHLQIRWGWLPAGVGVDPTVSAPNRPYWLLDIDSFTGKGGPFDTRVLDDLTTDLAERAHRFFRWVVTDEFLKRFGGQL